MSKTPACIWLSPADRATLEGWVGERNTPQKLAWRARIVLLSADRVGVMRIARAIGKSKVTVGRWQERYLARGVEVLRQCHKSARLWVDNVKSNRHLKAMREDRYRGTALPRPVRKLCGMAEREADRVHPERLRGQAVVALMFDAEREISPEFLRRLREHDTAPSPSYSSHSRDSLTGMVQTSGIA